MESYASFPRHQRNKTTALHQPAGCMAHGLSSSVELVQGGHTETRVQLRFRAFCEYLWDCCAHQMDQSTEEIIGFFFSASVMCNNLVVSEPIYNLTFLIVFSPEELCLFLLQLLYWPIYLWLLISFLNSLMCAAFHGDYEALFTVC